ncbi:lipase family protein [Arsenicicoccus sp. oral taxon 190]|uniref:lipase family protein n=1 Tax=Arsenicicoccus sp. oral taxon 190 TaxID=1658671 RepID=UPI00067A0134|nr:lipase family protein [Arsenicicoccus sp. oral taxon 190]AKT50972.1 hypothetical protein ADJ73_05945 [Arsenicicoccus sp. oral taxon 190]
MTRPPSLDPFYAPVDGSPAPGEVVRIREVELATGVPARAWQVVHGSVGTGSRPTAVSGTVLVPTRSWRRPGERPVVSYGVGVHGLGRDCAPSYLLRTGHEPELPLIGLALGRGWTVAVTDGEGLGMAGPHTYGAGDPGGHAMLDVLRAGTYAVPGVSARAPMALWGYSEGGRCAAWAGEVHPGYAPELPLRGVAAGGVPADLRSLARALDAGPCSGLALAVLVGLAHAYDRPELWRILNARGRAAAARVVDLDVRRLLLEHRAPLRELTVRDLPWDAPDWACVLDGELLGRRAPVAPTLLYHSLQDEVVPRAVARELRRDYEGRGALVDWLDVDAVDHQRGAGAGAAQALAWLARRLVPRRTG